MSFSIRGISANSTELLNLYFHNKIEKLCSVLEGYFPLKKMYQAKFLTHIFESTFPCFQSLPPLIVLDSLPYWYNLYVPVHFPIHHNNLCAIVICDMLAHAVYAYTTKNTLLLILHIIWNNLHLILIILDNFRAKIVTAPQILSFVLLLFTSPTLLDRLNNWGNEVSWSISIFTQSVTTPGVKIRFWKT